MKKLILLIIFLILFAILFLLIYINANSASLISQFLSNQLNSEVIVENASVGFGKIQLSNVSIPNHSGGKVKNDFTADVIDVSFDFKTLFKDTIQIESITLKKPTLYLELYNLTGSDNNWKQIFKNLASPAEQQIPSTEESKPASQQKEVIIDTFNIDELTIQAQHSLLGPYAIKIPVKEEIVFHNLTNHHALAYKNALLVLLKSLLETITQLKGFKEIYKEIPFAETKIPADVFENITQQLPKEPEPSEPSPKDTMTWEDLKDEVKAAPKKVKEFFNDLFR